MIDTRNIVLQRAGCKRQRGENGSGGNRESEREREGARGSEREEVGIERARGSEREEVGIERTSICQSTFVVVWRSVIFVSEIGDLRFGDR